ncbi:MULTISPECIES: AEC family transporter [unclassified Candidatus Tisiphia]|uniref:AEC family transporter n=1 Tax=Candidatus Tisiphia endosymbiont of Sergentomyia squamirostris TaxID=3113639 RepID=A0AAT9G781_9RICK|nr:AEC family transporter [Rickettsiaceae bacterium]MDD9337539.1 AEC family transporter [Rickettsiaceae bacterium]UCM93024.1 MAG: AEC family transporter [Rickettsia endosymbiont of Cimex lectularius]
MAIFTIVFFKTISVLLSVVIGFLAGRYSKVERDSIASLLFYFISPIVFFAIPASTTLTLSALSVTVVVFFIATSLSIFSYYFFGRYWLDHTRNIIALSAGTANGGYFMLPIAATLFDDYVLSIYMMAVIGINIFESSVGFYICARSFANSSESILKVVKLPILNGFLLGCLFSFAGFTLPDFLDDFIYNMRGAFSILGMVMVGLALSALQKFEIDIKFTLATFMAKFLFYPLGVNIFILLDKFVLGWYDENYYNALRLLSTAPMAANVIVIASLQKFYPEKVATTVFLSLLFGVVYIPVMVTIFLSDLN